MFIQKYELQKTADSVIYSMYASLTSCLFYFCYVDAVDRSID